MTHESFDLIVIGSGPGGYKTALGAAHQGARVALIEKAMPGGTCLNQGCIPKKTLLYLAGLIEDVNALNGRGLQGSVVGDFESAVRHKESVVGGIRKNFPVWLKRLGVRVFEGDAFVKGRRCVEVRPPEGKGRDVRHLISDRIVIGTGGQPREISALPVDGRRILTSRDFMFHQKTLPDSVLCVGGGAIGVELGYLVRQFGARVTIVERSPRLLDKPCIPERASAMLERKFDRLNVEIRKGVTVVASRQRDEGVEVELSDGTRSVYGLVLIAIGREPRTDGLGLERLGLDLDRNGFVATNEYLETSDVKMGPMTANAALHDAKIAAGNTLGSTPAPRNYNRVPIVIDSALEIASVGLTEERAEHAGFEPDVARASFGGSAKARGRHDFEGVIEVVHDEETGQLLGGCIVGPEAGEQIHMLTAACQSPQGLWFLKDISYSHPSWCEELENAIDPYAAAFIQSGRDVFKPGIYAAK
jgi:dihydrolipoamide dehydrogenase